MKVEPMSAPILTAALALTVLAVSHAHQQSSVPAIVPEIVHAEIPWYPPIALQARIVGEASVTITTDGERVTRMEAIDVHPMLLEVAKATTKTWRFSRHSPTVLRTRIRFEPREVNSCYSGDINPHARFDFPSEIVIQGVFQSLCHPPPPPIENLQLRIPRLHGTVTCDCPGGQPIEKAWVATDVPTRRGTRYVAVRTDPRGRFDFGNVPTGTYLLHVSAWGYFDRSLLIVVDRQDGSAVAEVMLKVDEKYEPVPPASVRRAQAALYPEPARLQQVDGDVRVRIVSESRAELVEGSPHLSEAALANARSWTFVQPPERPFEVLYRYRLTPGECGANQNPTVTMRFPTEVEITAKRRIQCGTLFVAPSLQR